MERLSPFQVILFEGILIASFILLATHKKEKYSPIATTVQAKTVMIEVPTIVERMMFTMNKKKLEVHQSTVAVNVLGAGVFISKTGQILTCAHVVSFTLRKPIIVVLSTGKRLEAGLVYKDEQKDLALLKVKGKFSAAVLSSRKLKLGQEVIAVGNPEGQEFSTSHGIISHLNRDIGDSFTFTQIDAPINSGNSGGPLFNMDGELIGINARKWAGSDGLGLAISPNTIREFLSQIN